MKNSNEILENIALFSERAERLNCTIIAVLNNVILCRRSDNTYITLRARVYIDDQKNGEVFAEFISGCYDMTADAAQVNLIERAFNNAANSGYYLVKLSLFLGEYEKHTSHVIKAANEEAAGLQALKNESHNTDAAYTGDACDLWSDGDLCYQVDSTRELTAIEADVLRGTL